MLLEAVGGKLPKMTEVLAGVDGCLAELPRQRCNGCGTAPLKVPSQRKDPGPLMPAQMWRSCAGTRNIDIQRWAHEVRLGSNRPRHADKDRPHVSDEEAQQSVEFAEALGFFLFELTKRIDRGTKAAKEAGDKASG